MPLNWGKNSMLPVADLLRAPDYTPTLDEYGRVVVEARAQAIAEDFVPAAFSRPMVVKRADGTYVMPDGNHRILAAHIKGLKQVPVVLYEGLTLAEEAALFVRVNQARSRVSKVSEFHAECVAHDANALALDALLLEHGLDGRGLEREGTIPFTAIAPAQAAVRFGGLELLDMSLNAMREGFTTPESKQWWGNTRTVQGTTEFFATTKVKEPPTIEEFVAIIKNKFVTPDALWQDAMRRYAKMGGGTGATGRRQNDAVVLTLVAELKKLRSDRRRAEEDADLAVAA
jgi:hypothetical protein